MKCLHEHKGRLYQIDLARPIPISIPIAHNMPPNAFHLPRPSIEPFRMGDFVGSVEEGGPVRCDVITFAPHGNGTHTECVGHIAGGGYVLPSCLQTAYGFGMLVTVDLEQTDRGQAVMSSALATTLHNNTVPILVLRTRPNNIGKQQMVWSGTNPAFIHPATMQLIVDAGIEHLIVDLPSVDPEEDGGKLEAHHIFWQWPHAPRVHCTITELVYVPDEVADGLYGINIGAAPFVSDAAPSMISLFEAVNTA